MGEGEGGGGGGGGGGVRCVMGNVEVAYAVRSSNEIERNTFL